MIANLEGMAAVELQGDRADVLALAEVLAVELAADRYRAHPRIVCVNFAWRLEALTGVRVAGSLDDVLADAETHRRQLDDAVLRRGPLAEQRRHTPQHTMHPFVVIDPHGRYTAAHRRLGRLAGPGLVVVTARPVPGEPAPVSSNRSTLLVSGRRLRWDPPRVDLVLDDPRASECPPVLRTAGMDVSPVHLNRPAANPKGAAAQCRPAVCVAAERSRGAHGNNLALLSVAVAGSVFTGSVPDLSQRTPEPAGPDLQSLVSGAIAGPVEIQVLGVVRVVGVPRPITSARVLSLICCLAFHRDGVTTERLRHLLWQKGEPEPNPKTSVNLVSRARNHLGGDDEGRPYLSYVEAGGTYRLSAQVTTDLARLAVWLDIAERLPPLQAMACLQAGLRLVRGVPFTGGRPNAFAWAENSWSSHIGHLVDRAVHRLVDLALGLERFEVARWATLRGLTVTPDCVECHRQRVETAKRAGSLREVESAQRELDRLWRRAGFEEGGQAVGVSG